MNEPNYISSLARRSSDPAISWLMKLTLDQPHLISLAAGFTDNETLPVAEVGALVAELVRDDNVARAALQYGSTAGDPELRKLTLDRVCAQDGIAPGVTLTADDVVITNGSQQLLYLLSEVLCDPGDIVLVEDPTYFVYLGICEALGIDATPVRLEPDGILPDELKRTLQGLKDGGKLGRLKFVYLVTYFQNPTGWTTSFEKKREAFAILRHYEAAAGHPIFVLEDAGYRDLRFAGPDIPSLKSLDAANERVAYSNTYTKPFATGIKVGYGVLPRPLVRHVLRSKGNHDFGSANFNQRLIALALRTGAYDRHLPKMHAGYRRRKELMGSAMKKYFPPSAKWQEASGGLYFWPELPATADTSRDGAIFRAALDAGVLYVPGDLCFASSPLRPKPKNCMRLSFGGTPSNQIEEGIKRLGAVLRSHGL
ncbi:MAG: PLP-dependent aminotransferase family protein [Verrucomicrobia bacterium]|nr:PLP-dependent aminotransferase family protein [Verrucomicrobiota bacterium]